MCVCVYMYMCVCVRVCVCVLGICDATAKYGSIRYYITISVKSIIYHRSIEKSTHKLVRKLIVMTQIYSRFFMPPTLI